MNPNEPQNASGAENAAPAPKKVITPLNPDEVKMHLAQNSDAAAAVAAPAYPAPSNAVPTGVTQPPGVRSQPAADPATDAEWKPNTTLAHRIPALRNYGLILVIGSVVFMFVNKGIWQFSRDSTAQLLGIIIYAMLGSMFIAGVILLLSKSKAFIQLCLNIIIGFTALGAGLSLLTFNVISLVLAVVIIVTVMNIKRYVRGAA